MANNIQIKDGLGNTREVKTIDTGGIHTPVHHAEGPLTNAELRAAAVNVAGPLAGGAINTVITGPLASGAVQVIGPVTDAQIRATPVPVSGPAGASVPVAITGASGAPVPVTMAAGSVVALNPPNYIPAQCGKFAITTGVTVIPIVAGYRGVRILAESNKAFFNLNNPPGTQTLGAASANGGIIWPNIWREIFWGDGGFYTSVQIKSDADTAVWVEFILLGTH